MNGKPVVAGPIRDNQDVFSIGTVRFNLIRRGARVAVRVRDSESDSRKKFTHLNWYAPDPSWRIEAKWIPFPQPKTLSFQTVIAGLREEMQAPGTAIFERAGKTYRLEPVVEDKELFYVFRDQTAGKTTYAAARYVYSDLPKDGKVIIDFNKATSPPCAFTSYATCPLPPPQNRLALAITAGETLYGTSKH